MTLPSPDITSPDNQLLTGAVFLTYLEQYADDLSGLSVREAMQLASFESARFKPNAQPIKKNGTPMSTAFGLTQPIRYTYFKVWCDIAAKDPERAMEMIENSGMTREVFASHFPNTFASVDGEELAAVQKIGATYKKHQVYHSTYDRSFPDDVSLALLHGRNSVENQVFFFIENNAQNAEFLERNGFEVTANTLYTLHNLGPEDGLHVLSAREGKVSREQINETITQLELLAEGMPDNQKQELLGHVDDLRSASEGIEFSVELTNKLSTTLSAEVRKNNRGLTSGGLATSYHAAVDRQLAGQERTDKHGISIPAVYAYRDEHGIGAQNLAEAEDNIALRDYKPMFAHLAKPEGFDDRIAGITLEDKGPLATRLVLHQIYDREGRASGENEASITRGIHFRVPDYSVIEAEELAALRDDIEQKLAEKLGITVEGIAKASTGVGVSGGFIRVRPTEQEYDATLLEQYANEIIAELQADVQSVEQAVTPPEQTPEPLVLEEALPIVEMAKALKLHGASFDYSHNGFENKGIFMFIPEADVNDAGTLKELTDSILKQMGRNMETPMLGFLPRLENNVYWMEIVPNDKVVDVDALRQGFDKAKAEIIAEQSASLDISLPTRHAELDAESIVPSYMMMAEDYLLQVTQVS